MLSTELCAPTCRRQHPSSTPKSSLARVVESTLQTVRLAEYCAALLARLAVGGPSRHLLKPEPASIDAPKKERQSLATEIENRLFAGSLRKTGAPGQPVEKGSKLAIVPHAPAPRTACQRAQYNVHVTMTLSMCLRRQGCRSSQENTISNQSGMPRDSQSGSSGHVDLQVPHTTMLHAEPGWQQLLHAYASPSCNRHSTQSKLQRSLYQVLMHEAAAALATAVLPPCTFANRNYSYTRSRQLWPSACDAASLR